MRVTEFLPTKLTLFSQRQANCVLMRVIDHCLTSKSAYLISKKTTKEKWFGSGNNWAVIRVIENDLSEVSYFSGSWEQLSTFSSFKNGAFSYFKMGALILRNRLFASAHESKRNMLHYSHFFVKEIVVSKVSFYFYFKVNWTNESNWALSSLKNWIFISRNNFFDSCLIWNGLQFSWDLAQRN